MNIKHSVIAFAGDWHGNTRYAIKALRHARKNNADVVIHTGDLGAFPDSGFISAINDEAERLGIQILFVDGNHENHEWLNNQPIDEDGVRRLFTRVWHLPRGFRWSWDGVSFLALGGAMSVDRDLRTEGVDWWPEETISDLDILRSTQGGEVDVMVTHDCPLNVDVPLSGGLGLSHEIIQEANINREAISHVMSKVNPRYLFHGHMHVRYDTTLEESGLRPCHISGLGMDGTPFTENLVLKRIQDFDN